MGLSDPVRVVVGVQPSPQLAAETAQVMRAISTQLHAGLASVASATGRVTTAMRATLGTIGSTLKSTFLNPIAGIAAGYGSFSAVKAGIEGMVMTGVDFNSTIENVTIGLAAMMRQMEPGRFKNFGSAMRGSQVIIESLKEEALKTSATFEQLAQSTQGLIGPMLKAGIPLTKVPATSGMLSRAVSALMPWAASGQFIQEGRALLTGQINQNAFLARALGITRNDVMEATRSGRMFEFLKEQLYAFNEAADYVMGTLTGLKSNLKDTWQAVMSDLTREFHADFKLVVRDLMDWLKSDDFKEGARVIIAIAKAVADLAVQAAKVGVGLADELGKLGRGEGKYKDKGGVEGAGYAFGTAIAEKYVIPSFAKTIVDVLASVKNIEDTVSGGVVKVENPGL